MTGNEQAEQPVQEGRPRRRGRPPKHGAAMSGAERQRRSVAERREAEEGLRYILYAAVQTIRTTPGALDRFQGYWAGTRTGRELAEKGLVLLPKSDRAAVRAMLSGERPAPPTTD